MTATRTHGFEQRGRQRRRSAKTAQGGGPLPETFSSKGLTSELRKSADLVYSGDAGDVYSEGEHPFDDVDIDDRPR